MRRALLVLALAALAAPGLAHAGVAHPNPAFVSPQLDYVEPLRGSDGNVASLAPLRRAVIREAVTDQAWLAYLRRDDLGGFIPARVGDTAFSSGGRDVVGTRRKNSEIPQFDEAAGGDVRSFAFTGGPTPPPDNGKQPVPGVGVPPTPPVPSNTNTVPPPNQGFGGSTPPPAPGTTTTTTAEPPGTTTTTEKPPPPPPTTTPTTTTTPLPPPTTTTTAPPPTTTAGGGGSPGDCGVAGLSVSSDLASCRINAVNMAPGQSTLERMTIRNDSGAPFTLKIRVEGTVNSLWNDLQLGIWEVGSPAPSPLPALLLWTAGESSLGTLNAGQTVTYQIELALAQSAGNGDQGKSATIDFVWHATG